MLVYILNEIATLWVKVVPNWLKWQENWSIFFFKLSTTKKCDKKRKEKRVVPNWTKWQFLAPPPPHRKKLWLEIKTIKVVPNWLKWREKWSKMIFNIFGTTPLRLDIVKRS